MFCSHRKPIVCWVSTLYFFWSLFSKNFSFQQLFFKMSSPNDLLLFCFYSNIGKAPRGHVPCQVFPVPLKYSQGKELRTSTECSSHVPCQVFPVPLKYSQGKELRTSTECSSLGPCRGASQMSLQLQGSISSVARSPTSSFCLVAGCRDSACFLFKVAGTHSPPWEFYLWDR